MEEDQDKFVKGFKDGYLLCKYEPDLLNKLINVAGTLDYVAGLKQGASQFEKEDKRPSWLKGDKLPKSNSLEDKNKEMGKENLEPEL